MNAPHGIRLIKAHNPWLVKPVVGRVKDLAGAMIHSTRSGKSDGDDGPRTEGWWSNPSNYVASYNGGSYADYLIYEDGLIVICTDLDTEIAWVTAGYGDAGTWLAGYYYIQIEMAQGNINDAYTDAQIESLAWLYAGWMDALGFPLHRIPFLFQTENPPPRGITTHDTCANGRKLGKSDPGHMFPWEKLFEKVEQYREEDDMAVDKAYIDAKFAALRNELLLAMGKSKQWDANLNDPNFDAKNTLAGWVARQLEKLRNEGQPINLQLAPSDFETIADKVADKLADRLKD